MRQKDDRINRALAKERSHVMTHALTTMTPPNEPPSPEVIAKVLLGGDLAQLTSAQQISYYRAVCDSVGLNPLTKPFEFLRLSGRLVLYALRNATDQIRHKYGISVTITARELLEDTYVVTARATLPNGRHDESIGAVPIAGLKGEARSNAMMKCETKSKRRVTLSLVGLSTLDESEVESIPGAQPLQFSPETGAITSPAPARSHARVEAPPPAVEPDRAGPANTNDKVPDSWKPFIRTEAITTTIVGGKRSRTTGKTTITLAGGAECWTTDHEIGKAAIAFKEKATRCTITLTEGNEVVTLAEATDAAF